MATPITVTAFQSALGACVDAINANNWVLAQTQLAAAEVINAGLEVEVGTTGSGGATVKRRDSLAKTQAMLETLRQLNNQQTGGSRFIATRTNYGQGRPRRDGYSGNYR